MCIRQGGVWAPAELFREEAGDQCRKRNLEYGAGSWNMIAGFVLSSRGDSRRRLAETRNIESLGIAS